MAHGDRTVTPDNQRRCRILRDFARVALAHGKVWNVLVRSWATIDDAESFAISRVLHLRGEKSGMFWFAAGLQSISRPQ
jgi:hypothetical protein